MSLTQSAPEEYPTLREHRTLVALYRLEDDALVVDRVIPVLFEAARTPVRAAEGATCPDFVYPNYQDHAYLKVQLDERSLATISERIGGLEDPLLRSMAWYDLFSMVQDAKLDLIRYLDILAANLAGETDLNVASDLLANLRTSFAYLYQVPPGAELLPREAARFEALLWQLLENSGGDARQLWLAGYIDTASNETAWRRLEGLLSGGIELGGLRLDQDQRWRIVLKLNEHRWPGHRELARAEAKRDTSSIGKANAMRAEVLSARGEAKYRWMQSAITRDDAYSLERSRDIVASLFLRSSQRQSAEPFAVEMIALLPELDQQWDVVFHDRVTRYLLPRLCTAENVARLQRATERYADINPAIVRGLKVAAQLDQRCVNIGLRLEAARQAAGDTGRAGATQPGS
jgi:aminopeptidase N